MIDSVSSARLEALDAERLAARARALHYGAAATIPVALRALGLVGWTAATTAVAAMVAAALWAYAASRAALQRHREVVDELIVNGWRMVAPDDVARREAELVSPRHRQMLASALKNQLEYASRGVAFTLQGRFVTAELRRLERQVDLVAARLCDVSRPVNPRGMVLVARLLSEPGSPLHGGPQEAIAPALDRVTRLLD